MRFISLLLFWQSEKKGKVGGLLESKIIIMNCLASERILKPGSSWMSCRSHPTIEWLL